MVKRSWPVLIPSTMDDDMDLLSHKLRLLKREVKCRIKKKRADMEKVESLILDDEIGALLTYSSSSILPHDD